MTKCPFEFICSNLEGFNECSNFTLTEAKLWCTEFKNFDKFIENKIKEMIK